MFTKLLTLSALYISACCLSIGTVSEQNVTKREASASDLFPDWVPFKNKHGDELGEFVQVQKKTNVKKRLALPMNFLMKALAAPEDDYYDKGAGESDSADYYEKKDWSDLHRPANDVDKSKVLVNHTDISDIDGVVDILTKGAPDHIVKAINSVKQYEKVKPPEKIEQQITTTIEPNAEQQDNLKNEDNESDKEDASYNHTPTPTVQSAEEQKEKSKDINNEEQNEQSEEEEEGTTQKPKTKEDKESEARKAKILSSVDELKERHAEEQRELSERIKEEDIYKDEFGKDNTSEGFPDRFSDESSEPARASESRKPTTKPDYDEYEDSNGSPEDKYKINVYKSEPTQPQTELPRKSKNKSRAAKEKRVKSGKLSVFKNPRLYMIYDDSDEATESAPLPIRGDKKFSSRYTTQAPLISNDERISLVPVEAKEGEPTLFFPKTRKNRRKRIKMTTQTPTDSSVAETVTDNYKQTTSYHVAAPESTESVSTPGDVTASDTTGTDYVSTGADAVAVNSDAATDVIPASSDHKKKESHDYSNKKGGGREHHSEHSEEHEEHGKKAYKGHHEDTKAAKGHHDRENHLGKYDDHGGVNKHHSEESGHYGDHHHEEHGKKNAKYEESGKHSKGHSTKGSHDVHKKEEYEKKVEFFEEDGDSDEEEKHGGYNHEQGHSEAGRFKKGNQKEGHEHHSKGEAGHFDKGGHHEAHKGHKQSHGHDGHGKHGQKHKQHGGHAGGKKWIYHHGSPAKTANLVVIDRRGDQYYHGPHYYG